MFCPVPPMSTPYGHMASIGHGVQPPFFTPGPPAPPPPSQYAPWLPPATRYGKTNYKYITPDGAPPNMGMVPRKIKPGQHPFGFPHPFVGGLFNSCNFAVNPWWPAGCNASAMPQMPRPSSPPREYERTRKPPVSGNRVGHDLATFNGSQNGYIFPRDHIMIHLFHDNILHRYQSHASSDGLVTVPGYDTCNSFSKEYVPAMMTVAEFIERVDCIKRANHHRSYPYDLIGIQEIHEEGNGTFRPGTKILLGDARSSAKMGDVFPNARGLSGGRPPYIVRIPVSTEITQTAHLIKSAWPPNTDLRFKVITLDEPPKKQLAPYLEAEHSKSILPSVDRKAFVGYYIRNTDKFHEAIVNLSTGILERNIRLGPNIHGNGDYDEILMVEKNVLEDEGVKALIAQLKLPEGATVCADPWIYGSDGIGDDDRLFQVFMYMRDPANPTELDSNHYAFPLPFSPVLDSKEFKVIRIDMLPIGADNTTKPVQAYQPVPPNEYISEHQKLRTDLKPLQVVQPEGASFKITSVGETGHIVEWQKWRFRVGYNQREGLVLYDVRYDSRPLFYRLSLSDMNIPYADPRHPFHKKAAFDLGDAGAGAMANNLKLGCDCLGHISYLSAVITDDKGVPTPLENCVCVHEQDAGIGWKHTNYRTGRAAVVRSRELVLQFIITVSNYEYILAFMFNQAGELIYEVRATGILSTQPIDHDLDKVGVPFGTVVHPGVLATHHQHIFSLRIDPMIDGLNNSLVYDEAYAMPLDPQKNPHGTGYFVQTTPVTHSAGLDLNSDTNRVFKITNPSSINPVNGKPTAYKIHAPPFQKLLAHPSSFHYKRAEFADHNIYVTSHRDEELYAGGWYTNQSRGGTGVRSWAARNDDLSPEIGSDIVLFVQFGINHVPRIEDFPVMPCEVIKVSLKPVNFFDRNPALDVPPSEQAFNRSTLVSEMHRQGGVGVEARVNGNGTVAIDNCCTTTANGSNGTHDAH